MGRRALVVLLAGGAAIASVAPARAGGVTSFRLILHPPARASGTVISATAFVERLERAASLAREGTGEPSEARMGRVRRTVGLPVTVESGGATTTVPVDPLLDGLSGDAVDDFRTAARHLDALARSARLAVGAPAPDRDRVRVATERALQGVATGQGIVARIRTAVSRFLAFVSEELFHFRGVGTLVGWGFVLLVGGAIFFLVRRFGPRWVQDREAVPEATPARALGPADWRREAERALAHGDGRAAVRALYSAMVASLRARGVVADRPSMTAGECRAQVAAAAPSLYPAVSDASTVFERVTYGLEQADDRQIARMRDADRSVEMV